jgi:hypothetical protein
MKNIITILLCSLLMINCNVAETTDNKKINIKGDDSESLPIDIKSELLFLGYRNKKPIFFSSDDFKLYIIKDNVPVLLKEYSSNWTPFFINSECIIYRHKDDKKTITVGSSNNVVEFSFENKFIGNIVADQTASFVYFSSPPDVEGYINRLNVKNGVFDKIKAEGSVHSMVNNNLYFTKSTDEETVYPNVDLYKYDFSSENTIEVTSNISGETTFVFPNEKQVACQILMDGSFHKVVIEIGNQSHTILEIGDDFEGIPYYSIEKKCLTYYKNNPFMEKCVYSHK